MIVALDLDALLFTIGDIILIILVGTVGMYMVYLPAITLIPFKEFNYVLVQNF